jgi:MPBQ/MSBQ methyltransferase
MQMNGQSMTPFESAETEPLVGYLTGLYRNAFTTDAIRAHLDNHVGFAFADYAVAVTAPHLPPGARVLDLGSGFGSYVIRARDAGLDAVGIEIAPFEVGFAQRRSRRLRPGDDAEAVYRQGDATQAGFAPGSFDAVTLWNVLEHIEDAGALLRSVDRLLRPGGQVFMICPNYAAVRDEAHYHVPWTPELSADRAKACDYLRGLGRDPAYYMTSVFCRTNQEVIGIMESLGYDLYGLSPRHPVSLRLRHLPYQLRNMAAVRAARGNAKPSVEIVAVKPASKAAA